MLRYSNVFGLCQDRTSHYSGVLATFCRKMLAGEQPVIFGARSRAEAIPKLIELPTQLDSCRGTGDEDFRADGY